MENEIKSEIKYIGGERKKKYIYKGTKETDRTKDEIEIERERKSRNKERERETGKVNE